MHSNLQQLAATRSAEREREPSCGENEEERLLPKSYFINRDKANCVCYIMTSERRRTMHSGTLALSLLSLSLPSLSDISFFQLQTRLALHSSALSEQAIVLYCRL